MEELQRQINELKERITLLEQKDDYDKELYEKLKLERNSIAKERGISAFCVFDNNIVKQIALQKPVTKDELIKIKGIKEMKYQQFGENFLQVVRTYLKTDLSI